MSDEILSALRDIRTTQLEQAEKNGVMAERLESLAGPQGRVTRLESTQTRQWWVSTAIAPGLMLLHQMLRKMGVQV